MSCKRHPYEQSVGVCASCLRERLLALIATRNKLASAAIVAEDLHRRSDFDHRSLETHVPFPRSVSPYFSHRRSFVLDVPDPNPRLHRFFSTPPASRFHVSGNASRRSNTLWSAVFGHPRSDSPEPRSSFSWLSAMIRRRKSGKFFDAAGSVPPARRRDEDHGGDSSYSSDSDDVVRLPGPTPVRQSRTIGGLRGVADFAVCLSPLVWSNPNRRRASDATRPGNSWSAGGDRIRRHMSFGEPGSIGVNRSRKLADFSRFK